MAKSLWLGTTSKTDYVQYKGDSEAEVVVVGGGIAGLLTAYFLHQSGIKNLVVLEARRIAMGVTGNTTAKITSLHSLIYQFLINKFGKNSAYLYGKANQDAIKDIADIIKELSIDCDFGYLPSYTYAINEKDFIAIKQEFDAAKLLELPAFLETKLDLPFKTSGAIRFDGQARFHPRKFLIALAQYLTKNNVKVFENSRVLDIEYGKTPVVKTESGNLKANYVVVATNFPVVDPNIYFSRLIPNQSYAIAASINKQIPTGMFISNEDNFRSYRPHPYNNEEILIIGGEPHHTGQGGDTKKHYEELVSWADETFGIKQLHFAWSTHDTKSLDRVPLIGKIAPTINNVFVATGFKGWGMTHSLVAGRLITDLINNKNNPYKELYNPSRPSSYAPGKIIKRGAVVAKELLKNLKPLNQKNELGSDEARIIDYEGQKLAIYKDYEGDVHAVSAKCTHQGCTVVWNSAENTWDCPCHGSRFDINGQILHSPAIRKLKKLNV